MPYIGKETAYFMAAAALAVLEAAEDLRTSLEEDGIEGATVTTIFCLSLIANVVLLFRLATRNDRLQRWQLRIVTQWLVRVARRNVALRAQKLTERPNSTQGT